MESLHHSLLELIVVGGKNDTRGGNIRDSHITGPMDYAWSTWTRWNNWMVILVVLVLESTKFTDPLTGGDLGPLLVVVMMVEYPDGSMLTTEPCPLLVEDLEV